MSIAKEVIAKNYGIVRYNEETGKYLLRNRNDKTKTIELDYDFLCDIEELAADLEYCNPYHKIEARARLKRALAEAGIYLNDNEEEEKGSGTGTAKPTKRPNFEKNKRKPKSF